MRRQSFRLLCARNLPGVGGCKPLLLAGALFAAGCGGGSTASTESQIVRGDGFRFAAPDGWDVEGAAAADGSVNRVEVKTFRLVKPYRPAVFAQASRELDGVVADLARQLHGKVAGARTETIAGRDSRSYRIRYDGKVSEVAFVLHGMREYELLCRRDADGSGAPCRQLRSSFALG